MALVLASVTLVTVSYKSPNSGVASVFQKSLRSITNPVRSSVNSVVRPVENVFSGAFGYSTLKHQNALLQEQVRSLKTKSLLTGQYQQEVQALTQLAHIPFAQGLSSVSAVVDNYSPSNTQLTIDINKGSNQGIKLGEPVVSSQGLVGKIVSLTSAGATVLLIADPSSSVGVTFGVSKHSALAIGSGSMAALKVDLVNPGTPLTRGEPMFTSGLQGGIYPPNIPVGLVAKFSSFPGALQEQVSISPVTDLAHLQFVKVLDWLPGGGK